MVGSGEVGQAGEGDGWPAPGGPPLTWADLLPGWPDDLTLERDDPGEAPPAPSAVVPVPDADELATRPPWSPATAAQRPLRPPALFAPPQPEDLAASRSEGVAASQSGGSAVSWPEDVASPRSADFAPSPFRDFAPAPFQDEEHLTDDDDHRLSGAGAFEDGSRSRLGAFDPGRRGVKALAAVAIVVVLIAALLAWRSRPRVDPVAPPGIDPAAADASLTDNGPASGAPRAKPSAPVAVVVAVGGKVRKPGLVELPPGARVADALKAAGGAAPGVDVAPLNLARKVTDGELIMVGVTPPPGAAPAGPAGPAAPAVPGQPGAGPINLNSATLADLDTLPGVGPVLAQRILAAREAQGGFKAVSDLRNVEGIGTARYDQLKDLVTV